MPVRQAIMGFKIKSLKEQIQPMLDRRDEIDKELEGYARDLEAEIKERTLSDSDFDALEKEIDTIEEERSKLEETIEELEEQTKKLEEQLNELNEQIDEDVEEVEETEEPKEKRSAERGASMEIRNGIFKGYQRNHVEEVLKRDNVQDFLERTRAAFRSGVTNVDILIPDEVTGFIFDGLDQYSKLRKYIIVDKPSGTSRKTIAGAAPEAIWTEMRASVGELEIGFNEIEVDGYKVGGYIKVDKSDLEDSDFNLAGHILSSLAKAIAKAEDKAILYGTGIKMPLGIVTRLAQATKPSDYPVNAPEWEKLSTTNIAKVTGEGLTLYKAIMGKAKLCKSHDNVQTKFWAMNDTTRLTLLAELLTFNSNGVAVAELSNALPVIGGDIVVLDFIPDGDIIGGYGNYALAERKGVQLGSSEHVFFLEDQIVSKGTMRADGKPVFADSFVAINIENKDVTTTVDFAGDSSEGDTP